MINKFFKIKFKNHQANHVKTVNSPSFHNIDHLNSYYDLRWKEAINELQENIQIENLPLEKNEGGLGVPNKINRFL